MATNICQPTDEANTCLPTCQYRPGALWGYRFKGSGKLEPARVQVADVDGIYTSHEALREAAELLLKLAHRLQEVAP